VKNQTQIAELLNNQDCTGLSVVRARIEESVTTVLHLLRGHWQKEILFGLTLRLYLI